MSIMKMIKNWLFPWKSDIQQIKQDLTETNRMLEKLVSMLEDKVAKDLADRKTLSDR